MVLAEAFCLRLRLFGIPMTEFVMVVADAIYVEMVSTNSAMIAVLIAQNPSFTTFALSGLFVGSALVRVRAMKKVTAECSIRESDHLFLLK